MSVIVDLAFLTASPKLKCWPTSKLTTLLSICTCGSGCVKPKESQTATAPPFFESSSASAKLSVYTSWKRPFRQFMIRNRGRRVPLDKLDAFVSSSKSSPDQISTLIPKVAVKKEFLM